LVAKKVGTAILIEETDAHRFLAGERSLNVSVETPK
jgi:hypothetical protein